MARATSSGAWLVDSDPPRLRAFDCELKKKKRLLRFIKMSIGYINKEIAGRGLERRLKMTPRHIHFLRPEDYGELFPYECNNLAFYNVSGDLQIYIRMQSRLILQWLSIILHELVHAASIGIFYYDEKSETISCFRSGFHSDSIFSQKRPEHFKALNEVITDVITAKILYENRDEIVKRLGLRTKDWPQRGIFLGYKKYMPMLEAVALKFSAASKLEPEKLINLLIDIYLGKSIFSLRLLEKNMGHGLLRLLANLSPRTPRSAKQLNHFLLLLETKSHRVKKSLARKILCKSEYRKYRVLLKRATN